jgi:hypothetical protein
MFLERDLVAGLLGWAILLTHLAHRAFLMRHRHGLRKVTWELSAAQNNRYQLICRRYRSNHGENGTPRRSGSNASRYPREHSWK